jgi:ribose transport system permease protein
LSATTIHAGPPRPALRHRIAALMTGVADRGLAVWIVVAAVVVVASLGNRLFLTQRNAANLFGQLTTLGLAAVGQMFAVLAGAIDLSVGSMAKLAAVLTAGMINGDASRLLPVIALVLALGAFVGLVNGLLITRLRIAPFIVTLGMFSVLRGLALAYTTTPVGSVPTGVTEFMYSTVGPLPAPFVVFAVLAAAAGWVLRGTVFGRRVYAVGGDPEVARMAGIKGDRVIIAVMVISATFAALAGVMQAARSGVGAPSAGDGLELSAITAVVLGGTSLFGGHGRLVGTLGGVLLVALIDNALNLLGVPSFYKDLVRGMIIVAAVAIFIRKD